MNSKATKKVCSKCQFEDETGLDKCPRDGMKLTAKGKDPLIGQVLADKYEIQSMLGKGGMSVVYKARHTMMNRTVAVKMLRPELVAVPQLLQRFKQESNAVSALRHPNIVTVFDYGLEQSSGTPYLIMDYLEGDTMSVVLKRDKLLTLERALPLFAQACDALAHAHDQGIIHRDIKPANLLLRTEKSGEEALTIFDFGIAKMLGQDGSTIHKLTTSGEVFGSPLYMSPEQCSGEHITKKTDTYSLACVFYECLVGQPPLGGTSPMETLMKHVNEDPPTMSEVRNDLEIPELLEDAIMQALEKDPDNRQVDMREFRDQILDAGGLRRMVTSLHLTAENNLMGKEAAENLVSGSVRSVSSSGNVRPPRKTGQKSGQMKTHSTKNVPVVPPEPKKKIPMPLLIGIAMVIAFGTFGLIVYTMMHHNEVVMNPEGPVEANGPVDASTEQSQKDPDPDEDREGFDGKVELTSLSNLDQMQLSELSKVLLCRVGFDGKMVSAVPPSLLVNPAPNRDHTDMKSLVIAVQVEPSNISCTQAAEAVFDQVFKDVSDKPVWEKITEGYGSDTRNTLVQEITFTPPDDDGSGSATPTKGDSSGSKGTESDGNSTSKPDTGSGANSDSPAPAKKSGDGGTGDAQSGDNASSDSASDSKAGGDSPEETTKNAVDANKADALPAAGVYKEYIVYMKHKKRLIACQVVPLKITAEELEKTISELVPNLKAILKKQ